jgi:hypothetical protein
MAKLNVKNLASIAINRGGGSAAGGAASALSNKVIPASINPLLKGIGKIVIGAMIPELMPKNEMVKFAGAGFAGHAAGELTDHLMAPKTVSGLGDETYTTDADASLSGTDSPINGVGETNIEME